MSGKSQILVGHCAVVGGGSGEIKCHRGICWAGLQGHRAAGKEAQRSVLRTHIMGPSFSLK